MIRLVLFLSLVFAAPASAGFILDVDKRHIAMPFEIEVSRGRIPPITSIHKFGHNNSVSTTLETVWPGSVQYTYLASEAPLTLSSGDVDDTSAGAGARTVFVEGLDGNYNEVTETISLNGQTGVTTVNSYLRIFRMRVMTAGATEGNEGVIYGGTGTVTSGVPANVYAQLEVGLNQTTMGLYTVPAGKTAYITELNFSLGSGKELNAFLVVREFNSTFQVKFETHIYQTAFEHPIGFPFKVPEKSDIELRATSSTGPTDIAASFELILVDGVE